MRCQICAGQSSEFGYLTGKFSQAPVRGDEYEMRICPPCFIHTLGLLVKVAGGVFDYRNIHEDTQPEVGDLLATFERFGPQFIIFKEESG